MTLQLCNGGALGKQELNKFRHESFRQQLQSNDTFCCKCGSSLVLQNPSIPRPLGRLHCRSCQHSACLRCKMYSPWILRSPSNQAEIDLEPDSSTLLGFICCNRACGWSQTIVQARYLAKQSHTIARIFKPWPKTKKLLFDFAGSRCEAFRWPSGKQCHHYCCDKCVKFKLIQKDQGVLQEEQRALDRETKRVRQEQELLVHLRNQNKNLGDLKNHRPCGHLGHGLAGMLMNCQVEEEAVPGGKWPKTAGTCSQMNRANPSAPHYRRYYEV